MTRSTFFDVVFPDRLKNSSIFCFCKLHTRNRVVWHLNLKILQSTSHGKLQVILDLQRGSIGVKGLTQIYIYIYIYRNLATVLRRCYGDDVRLFNKAKNLPSLSVTGLLFNQQEFFLFIFHGKPMLKHM